MSPVQREPQCSLVGWKRQTSWTGLWWGDCRAPASEGLSGGIRICTISGQTKIGTQAIQKGTEPETQAQPVSPASGFASSPSSKHQRSAIGHLMGHRTAMFWRESGVSILQWGSPPRRPQARLRVLPAHQPLILRRKGRWLEDWIPSPLASLWLLAVPRLGVWCHGDEHTCFLLGIKKTSL